MLDEESDVMCCRFQGKRLFVGLASGQIRVYTCPNKTSLTCQYILDDPSTHRNSVTSLEFVDIDTGDDEPMLVATYVNGLIKFWHVTSRQCLTAGLKNENFSWVK